MSKSSPSNTDKTADSQSSDQVTSSSDQTRSGPRRKWRWIFLPIIVLLITGISSYWWVQYQVRQRVIQQLEAVYAGPVKVGAATLGWQGLTASDVQLFASSSDDTPVLTAQDVRVDASLSSLLSDRPELQRIQVDNVAMNLEWNEDGTFQKVPMVESDGSWELPAPAVEIRNLNLRVSQQGKQPLEVQASRTKLVQEADEIQVSAEARWSDSDWRLQGSLNQQQAMLQANSDRWQIDSDQLMKTPGVPDALLQPLDFRGPVAAQVTVRQNGKQTPHWTGSFRPSDFEFRVPRFDLDMQITDADIQWEDQDITISSATAALGGGQATGNGTVTLNWPVAEGDFQASWNNVDVDAIRGLAQIPDAAQGRSDATGSGQFAFGGQSGLELSFTATGEVQNGSYEQISLQPSNVAVTMNRLALASETYDLEQLDGQVDISTAAQSVNLYQFLINFGLLEDPDNRWSRLIGGTTDAVVQIGIPLATFDQIASWSLTATTSDGTIDLADQELSNIESVVELQEGNLTVSRMVGTGGHPAGENARERTESEPGDSHRIYVTGKWPLPANQDTSRPSPAGSPATQDTSPTDGSEDLQAVQDPEVDQDATDQDRQDPDLDEGNSQQATFRVEGSRLSVRWLLAIAQEYNVDVKQVITRLVPDASGAELDQIDGHLTVNADLTIPANTPGEFSRWEIDCQVVSGDLVLPQVALSELKGEFQLRNQIATITDLTGQVSQGQTTQPLNVSATVPFDNTKAATVQATLPQLPVALLVTTARQTSPDFESLAQQLDFDQKLPINGLLSLTLDLERPAAVDQQPGVWNADVQISSDQLVIKDKPLERFEGNLIVNRDSIRIPQLEMQFEDGGSLKTSGTWPLNDADQGEVQVEWMKVPLKWVLDLVPSGNQQLGNVERRLKGAMASWQQQRNAEAESDEVAERPSDPVPEVQSALGDTLLSGNLTLTSLGNQTLAVAGQVMTPAIQWTIGRGNLESTPVVADVAGRWPYRRPEETQLSVDIRPSGWQVDTEEINDLTAHLDLTDQILAFQAEAGFLEGNVTANGSVDFRDRAVAEPIRVSIDQVRLRPAIAAFLATPNRDLDAVMTGSLLLTLTDEAYTIRDGQMNVSGLQWKQHPISERTEIDFTVGDNQLTISRLRGDLANGLVEGRFRLGLAQGIIGDYELRLRRVDLERMLRPLHRQVPETQIVNGLVTSRLSGRIGSVIDGSGSLAIAKSDVYGVQASSLKVPILLKLDPNTLNGTVELRQSQFRAFRGSLSGKGKISFGRRLDIDIDASLFRIDTDQLLGTLAGRGDLGQGELYGDLKLKGTSVRSLRDLNGSFIGRLEHSRSFQFPLMRNLAIFLNSGRLTQQEFDSREIVFRLAKGILKVERLTFASDSAQMYVTGQVTTEGRLDLDIATRIANLSGNRQLYEQLSGNQVALLLSPTGTALTEVTEFLSNRVIYLHAGGTVRQPNFRIESGRLIRDELIARFFASSDAAFMRNFSP